MNQVVKLLLLIAFVISSAFAQCGPPQCYNGCTDASPLVDFVFIIDLSSSMDDNIKAVTGVLTSFAQVLQSASINPSYTIVTFAGIGNDNQQAKLTMPLTTSFSTFKSTMSILSTGGYREAGLETIRMSLNATSTGNLNIAYRSNSKIVLILLTDEDSDPAVYPVNRFQSPVYTEAYYSDLTSQWTQYQDEINSVANDIIAKDAMLYLVIPAYNNDVYTTLTFNQYGNPNLQSQNADFSNFYGAKTYNNLENAHKGYENSIQGILLKNGKVARVFDVNQFISSNSNLIRNFFLQITVDLGQCKTCFDYPCNGLNCQAPVNICGCDGIPHSRKTNDPEGKCCLASQKDCMGYCPLRSGGNYNYDTCGVCTLKGVLSPLCIKDSCNNIYYLTAKPTVPYKTDGCDDAFAAGYVVQNTDLWNDFNSASGSLKTKNDICNQYHNYGRFEKRFTCKFDIGFYNQANGVSTGLTHFFARSPPRTGTRCIPGSRTPASPIPKNSCNVCVPFPDAAPFCELSYDPCNQPLDTGEQPPYPCLQDCVGNYYRDGIDSILYKVDDCGVCNLIANMNELKDACGMCTNVAGYDSATECTPDCKGNYYLADTLDCSRSQTCKHAFTDNCGDCWFANETEKRNMNMDDCGECHDGGESDPNWNILKNKNDTQGVFCPCFVDPVPCPSPNQVFTTCNDGTSCPSLFCPGTSSNYSDECGLCPDSSMYDRKDECGICCDPPNIECNQDKDSCGECFGFDKQKTLNPCGVCNGTTCTVDCLGIPYGTAVVDCQGICGGNSVCSKCGNGVVDEGESCDLGADNGVQGSGCTLQCESVTGQNNPGQNNLGKIVGGVIGGIGAIVLLVLVVIIIFKPAKSKGKFKNELMEVDSLTSDSTQELLKTFLFGETTLANTKLDVTLPGFMKIDFISQIRKDKKIGGGGAAVIYKGVILDPKLSEKFGFKEVAIKELFESQSLSQENFKQRFEQEIAIVWTISSHPNIITLVGYSENPCCITTKLYDEDLHNYIKNTNGNIPTDIIVKFAKDIASGMNHIHSSGIVHRDLKSSNILIQKEKKELSAVICDFGLAGISSETNIVNQKIVNVKGFSPRYTAPEVFGRMTSNIATVTIEHEMKSDVYSYSLILWELMTKKIPWAHLKETADIEFQVRSGKREEIPETHGNKDLELISTLIEFSWNQNPSERPTSHQITQRLSAISPF